MTTVERDEFVAVPLTAHKVIKLCLAVISLICLLIWVGWEVPMERKLWLRNVDSAIALYFLSDFINNLREAPDKLRYLRTWGWFDLLASLPYPGTRISMLLFGAQLGPWFRVMHGVRCVKSLLHTCYVHCGRKKLLSLSVLTVLLLVILSSVTVMNMECPNAGAGEINPNVNIKTLEDAIWWSVATLSTTGYGDRYPVTSAGRVLAMMLIMAGVAAFALFTGLVSSSIIEANRRADEAEAKTRTEEVQQPQQVLTKSAGQGRL